MRTLEPKNKVTIYPTQIVCEIIFVENKENVVSGKRPLSQSKVFSNRVKNYAHRRQIQDQIVLIVSEGD